MYHHLHPARGVYQLRATIRDTDIPGSPFTIRVPPTPEMRGVLKNIISGLTKPWGVAVSKSGEVVVRKIRSFGSKGSRTRQFLHPRGVAITSDNHILVIDERNHRILTFTIEGRFLKSVGQKGKEQLQFKYPCIRYCSPRNPLVECLLLILTIILLCKYLTQTCCTHTCSVVMVVQPGQFSYPSGVAIDNSGVVYATDEGNHRVQFFSADEQQFISTFSINGSQHGQLYRPVGICVDSTNTVHVCHLS